MSEPLILQLGVVTDGTPEGTQLVDRETGREVQLPGVTVELEIQKPVPLAPLEKEVLAVSGTQADRLLRKHLPPLPHEATLRIQGAHLPVLLLPATPASLGSLTVVHRS